MQWAMLGAVQVICGQRGQVFGRPGVVSVTVSLGFLTTWMCYHDVDVFIWGGAFKSIGRTAVCDALLVAAVERVQITPRAHHLIDSATSGNLLFCILL